MTKKMTAWKTDGHTVMDFHDGEPPIVADLTLDELLERIRRAVAEGYAIELRYPRPAEDVVGGEKPDCYDCAYRASIQGDAHSACLNVHAHVTGKQHGIDKGWFMWPINYDPVWLFSCDGFKPRDKARADADEAAREAYYDDIARQEAANPPCAIHDAFNCSICNAWVKA